MPPLKILVCDDERHIVRLIQVNLEKQGYQVVTAYDGKEGLEKVKAEKPDLLVLDVMMPYMDGFEVLKSLRREPETESLPVIMLTAKAQDKDVFEGYHYGADMYLTKPFNPMELVSFVKRIAQGADSDSGAKRFEL
ncbi:MAG: response regulator transcription factor [Fimbriimonadaceae bacterium]